MGFMEKAPTAIPERNKHHLEVTRKNFMGEQSGDSRSGNFIRIWGTNFLMSKI